MKRPTLSLSLLILLSWLLPKKAVSQTFFDVIYSPLSYVNQVMMEVEDVYSSADSLTMVVFKAYSTSEDIVWKLKPRFHSWTTLTTDSGDELYLIESYTADAKTLQPTEDIDDDGDSYWYAVAKNDELYFVAFFEGSLSKDTEKINILAPSYASSSCHEFRNVEIELREGKMSLRG